MQTHIILLFVSVQETPLFLSSFMTLLHPKNGTNSVLNSQKLLKSTNVIFFVNGLYRNILSLFLKTPQGINEYFKVATLSLKNKCY